MGKFRRSYNNMLKWEKRRDKVYDAKYGPVVDTPARTERTHGHVVKRTPHAPSTTFNLDHLLKLAEKKHAKKKAMSRRTPTGKANSVPIETLCTCIGPKTGEGTDQVCPFTARNEKCSACGRG